MREYIEAAIARGIGEIGLTDHLFLYFREPERRDARWAMPEQEYEAHYREMQDLRDEYRGRIAVRVSVEADHFEGKERELERILSRYDFDYVLGSVHFLGEWLMDDPEQTARFDESPIVATYRSYYRRLELATRTGLFDLLAHLDLPKKFGHLPEETLEAEIGSLLDSIRSHDLAVEVSTAGLRKPIREIYPSETILRLMFSRDIPIALSSDAHTPEEIGFAYDKATELVNRIGYRNLVTFEKRKRSFAPLG